MEINKYILWLEDNNRELCKEYFSVIYENDVTTIGEIDNALEMFESSLAFVDLIVLDIDFKNGIISSNEIIERLNKNGVLIIDNKSLDENAGYYLFLYLLRKGFPSDRICILSGNTGNAGTTGTNTSGKWEEVFKCAGLEAPIPHCKEKNKIGYSDLEKAEKPVKVNTDFLDWLNEKSTDYFKIRRCVIALCNIIKKYLETEKGAESILIMKNEHKLDLGKKYFIDMLSSVMNLPMLYKKNNIDNKPSEEQKIFKGILSQITHDWEAIKFIDENPKDNYANKATMKLLRNWIAHSRLSEDELNYKVTAFLFGIAMRALFDVKKDENLEKSYCAIEDKLISIFDSPTKEDNAEISNTIEKSNKDFLQKLTKGKCIPFKLGNTLGLIQFLGGDKKNDNPIKCKYSYIIRYFGHSILKTNFSEFEYKPDGDKITCYTSFNTKVTSEEGNDKIRDRYLRASLGLWDLN